MNTKMTYPTSSSKVVLLGMLILSVLLFLIKQKYSGQITRGQMPYAGCFVDSPPMKESDIDMHSYIGKTLHRSAARLQFVENKGQKNLPPEVLGYFTSHNLQAFIEKKQLRIVSFDPHKEESGDKTTYRAFHSVAVHFEGAQEVKLLLNGNPFKARRNFFTGSQAVTDVRSYDEITLTQLYPGIDLRLYSTPEGQLEFDWLIAPGADYQDIQLRFEGQDGLELTEDNTLAVRLRFGDFHINIPESYQVSKDGTEKEPVLAQMHIDQDNLVTYQIEQALNPQLALVIDPILNWGTFYDNGATGGTVELFTIALDDTTGDIYVSGSLWNDVDATYVGAAAGTGYDVTHAGGQGDAFVYRLNSDGSEVTAITLIGGSQTDKAYGLDLSTNRVWICGETGSPSVWPNPFPTTAGSFKPTTGSSFNASFVASFSRDLSTLHYSSFITESTGEDKLHTIIALSDTDYYVGGHLTVAQAPNLLVNAIDNTHDGSFEGYIARFTGESTLVHGTYTPGSFNVDRLHTFELLSDDEVVFVGEGVKNGVLLPQQVNALAANDPGTSGTLFSSTIGKLTIPATGTGATLDYFDVYGGSTGHGAAYGLKLLGNKAYISGRTTSGDFPQVVSGAIQSSLEGGILAFGNSYVAVVDLNNTADFQTTYLAGVGYGNQASAGYDIEAVSLDGGTTGIIFVLGVVSDNLNTSVNYNEEPFYYPSHGGATSDMLLSILSLDLTTLHYQSSIGGNYEEWQGGFHTTAPIGGDNIILDSDNNLIIGLNNASSDLTHNISMTGRSSGSPYVFDWITPGGVGRQTHLIMSIGVGNLIDLEIGDGPFENTMALCLDGLDNDGDGNTDCTDSDCIAILVGCSESTPDRCSDGIDNDGDGLIDCADSDCAGIVPCGDENTPDRCSDGIDNDGDGLVDCADGDCANLSPCCPIAAPTVIKN